MQLAEVNQPEVIRRQIAELRARQAPEKSSEPVNETPPALGRLRTRHPGRQDHDDRRPGRARDRRRRRQDHRHGTPRRRPGCSEDHRTHRRRGLDSRSGRCPRPRQRARPDRLGGLRFSHQGGRRRWSDHDRGHAAELDPVDGQRTGPGAEAVGRRAAGLRGHRFLGRRRSGQQGVPARTARRRGLRLQVLPPALRGRRVPAPRRRPARGVPRGAPVLRRLDDRARGGLARHRPRAPIRRATSTGGSCPPGRAGPRISRSPR